MKIVPFDPSVLAELLDTRFAVSVASTAPSDAQLLPAELAYIQGAVTSRRAEFATARVCARSALFVLGVAPCALVPRADRAPWWPDGVTGSITHTYGACAVAVTTAPEILGVGIDIERDDPLPDELLPIICTKNERKWLDAMPLTAGSRLAKTVFSAKEAVYKCQYPVSSLFLDFLDVEITFDKNASRAFCGEFWSGHFTVAPSGASKHTPAWLARLRGRFKSISGFLITVAVFESAFNPETRTYSKRLVGPKS